MFTTIFLIKNFSLFQCSDHPTYVFLMRGTQEFPYFSQFYVYILFVRNENSSFPKVKILRSLNRLRKDGQYDH